MIRDGAVVHELELAAPPAEVFRMFTEPTQLVRWIGVSADLKSRGSNTISIIAGDRSDDHVNHIINGATRIALEETGEGAHKGLRIEAADGATTLLLFRSPALPETVDGVLLR